MTKLSKIFLAMAGLALLAFVVAKSLLGSWMPFYTILLVFVGSLAGAVVYLERRLLIDFFTMKTTKHGMNMGLMITLVIILLSLTNYIAVKRNITWDLSQAKTNTLSDQSIQLVKSLKSDLKIYFFYKEGTQGVDENRKAFRDIVKKYQDQSNRISLEFVEANQKPKMAEEFGVNRGSGLAFVEYNGKRNRLEKVDEQEITQAIIKVTREKAKTVYVVSGHGEPDIEDSQEAGGLNMMKLLIENNSFIIKTWNLPSQPKVPEDADAILLIGPQQKMADYEIKELEKYLISGGNLMLALESGKSAGLESLLGQLGIVLENNYIKSSYLNLGYIDGGTIGNVFSLNSPVTKVFANERDIVRFEWPMNLKKVKEIDGISIEPMVRTDQNSTAFPTPDVKKGDFPRGPFHLGLDVKGKFPGSDNEFQLLVYGDSQFMTNSKLYDNLNRDLTLNSVSYLTKEENLISITPREVARTQLLVTTAKLGGFYLVMFLIPFGLLIISLFFWVRRRGEVK
ncbi:MAG: GldG family protein [Bdellovibrionales bacterium]